MLHINQALLQFIDVVNLVDLCWTAAFSTHSGVNRVQICAVGWQKVWQNERRCLVSEG